MHTFTLKSFPFILRDWDVQSYDSMDPTDSFGQDTNIYINKNQVIKIEPQFSNSNSNIWLTDKGRQFFDGMFNNWNKSKKETQPVMVEKNKSNSLEKLFELKMVSTKTEKQWETLFKTITKILYIFDLCNFKNAYKFFFILIFENISLEALNLLFLLTQTHSFIKLRRAENLKTNIDLETSLQINSGTCVSKLSSSSLCLLIATDTRYEGSYINLKLRQRYFKGSFKLITIGSLKYLTFPIFFLGSNTSILKTIAEGNNTTCLDLKDINFFLIYLNNMEEVHNIVNILISHESFWLIMLTILLWNKKNWFFTRLKIKPKTSNHLATDEKIWENPSDSPMYEGKEHSHNYTGCRRLPNCKLTEKYIKAEIPSFDTYTPCGCILPQGGQDIREEVINKYSHTSIVKKIRRLQKHAEILKNKRILDDPTQKRIHHRDIKQANELLDSSIKDLKNKIMNDKNFITDHKYYSNRDWQERIKVYPDPATIKIPNMTRLQIHRKQDHYILKELDLKRILDNIKQEITNKSKSSSYSSAEMQIDLNRQQDIERRMDELSTYMKSMGFKK